MPKFRHRASMALSPLLILAACGGRPGETQVSRDARLVLAAITPLAHGAAGYGLAPQPAAEVNEALSVADAEAGNLSAQVIPRRIDVQDFLLAARAMARTLRAAPALPPPAAKTLDAVTALLPAMADQVSVPFAAPAPSMPPDQARLVLQGAVPPVAAAPQAAPPVVSARDFPSPPTASVAPSSAAAATSEPPAVPAGSGLVTVPSHYSVAETLARAQAAIRAKGWTVFALIDHAAAARAAGLALRPRTVILFGDPRIGTESLRAAPTLGIDLPPRALVWQDDAGAVWFTTNAAAWIGAHVDARHGITLDPAALRGLAGVLDDVTRQATQ